MGVCIRFCAKYVHTNIIHFLGVFISVGVGPGSPGQPLLLIPELPCRHGHTLEKEQQERQGPARPLTLGLTLGLTPGMSDLLGQRGAGPVTRHAGAVTLFTGSVTLSQKKTTCCAVKEA